MVYMSNKTFDQHSSDEDAPEATKKANGRPPHVPTDDQRQKVKSLIWAGFTLERTAQLIGIAEATLAKHYRPEIDEALGTMMANVGQTLYQKALNGDTTAAIFIAKTRLGWKEKPTEIEVSGKDGGPIEVEEKNAITSKLLGILGGAKKEQAQ